MYINSVGYYIPSNRLDNKYFASLSNLEEEWFVKRTGIQTRSRASEKETIDLMSIEAVKKMSANLPYGVDNIDLIIFASYTPSDTIGTTAHVIQKEFQICNAKVFSISSACSSAINGMEIIRSFFQSGISSKALLVCAERNSSYLSKDTENGHLWGDAAVALSFSKEAFEGNIELVDIISQGLGHIGRGVEAISLNLQANRLTMPYGKEVFSYACTYMQRLTNDIVKRNGYSVKDLDYFIGHQANKRILTHVCYKLDIPQEKIIMNVESYGNTGCAGAPLAFAEHHNRFQTGELICMTVFGGGYSTGSCLLIKN